MIVLLLHLYMLETQQCIGIIITLHDFMSIKEDDKRKESTCMFINFMLTFVSAIPGSIYLYLMF